MSELNNNQTLVLFVFISNNARFFLVVKIKEKIAFNIVSQLKYFFETEKDNYYFFLNHFV